MLTDNEIIKQGWVLDENTNIVSKDTFQIITNIILIREGYEDAQSICIVNNKEQDSNCNIVYKGICNSLEDLKTIERLLNIEGKKIIKKEESQNNY